MGSDAAYLEIFRPTDLLPGNPAPLIYARRVASATGGRGRVNVLSTPGEGTTVRITLPLQSAAD